MATGQVTVVQRTFIRPSPSLPQESLELGKNDTLTRGLKIVLCAFFPHNKAGEIPASATKDLQNSLEKALGVYPLLAGRVEWSEDGSGRILTNGEGAAFIATSSDATLQETLEKWTWVSSPFEEARATPKEEKDALPPPLRIVCNKFTCGGLALEVEADHTVTDGDGLLSFLSTWAGFAKGVAPSVLPVFDRSCMAARVPPKCDDYFHPEFQPLPAPPPGAAPPPTELPGTGSAPSTSLRSFFFPRNKAKDLLEHCNGAGVANAELIALTAWFIQCVTKAHIAVGVPGGVKLLSVVNGRGILTSCPENYFGNAHFFSQINEISKEEVATMPLRSLFDLLRSSLSKVTQDLLRSKIDCLHEYPNAALRMFMFCTQKDSLLYNWEFSAKESLYHFDFGFGPAQHFRLVDLSFSLPGAVFVIPAFNSKNNKPGYEFAVSLSGSAAMSSLEKLLHE